MFCFIIGVCRFINYPYEHYLLYNESNKTLTVNYKLPELVFVFMAASPVRASHPILVNGCVTLYT